MHAHRITFALTPNALRAGHARYLSCFANRNANRERIARYPHRKIFAHSSTISAFCKSFIVIIIIVVIIIIIIIIVIIIIILVIVSKIIVNMFTCLKKL